MSTTNHSNDSSPEELFLWGAEVHSADEIARSIAAGLDPNARLRGYTPIQWLVERMYLRSPRMVDCLDTLLDAGATFDDRALLAVLRDDAGSLDHAIATDPSTLEAHRHLACSFTSLAGVSLLHVAAEFGSLRAASFLLDAGVDVDVRAELDGRGLNAQTPIFHTVNQHRNHCQPVLRLLLERGASTDVRLRGLVWGDGFEWETTLFDVTLLSYTQFGLLPQFQRVQEEIYDNVRLILATQSESPPRLRNVPNRYLQTSSGEDPG